MNNQIELTKLQDFTYDYNQTTNLTLDIFDLNHFGAQRVLTLQIHHNAFFTKLMKTLFISSVIVTASQARFHSEDPIYYLSNLRILAGFS